MIVHFGLHLDGMTPEPPHTAAGIATAGPARLLDLLELQLGLPTPSVRPGQALLAYKSCLEDLDGPRRFYHRSLAIDPLGVARTLLAWRAAWHEAGWRGRFTGSVSRRLADLADVETLARERVPPNPGQRLQRIAAALDDGLVTQIERIVLHDEIDALPAAWRDVLAHFRCETAEGVAPAPRAAADTDLLRIQERLLALDDDAVRTPGNTAQDRGSADARIRLRGDDSLIVVRGASRDVSAQVIGEYLRSRADRMDDVVVIAERDGIIVDNALERVGLPRAGFQHYSRFRAVTQVLKLALALVWKPLGPRPLLQFLLHPVGPLPGRVRSALAEAVASEPGVGGHAWADALAELAERERQAAAERGDTDAEARIEALRADVRYWLECERFAPDDGAPTTLLIERAQRCSTWLARRLNATDGSERELFAAALAQSEALIDALASLRERGTEQVGRLLLERLVDEVTGFSPDPAIFSEAGHVRATTSAATITRPWDTVIWWDIAAPAERVDYPWSDAELAELRGEGVALPSTDDVIRRRARAWTRPVLNARRRLVLVVHDADAGHHPLWSRLTSIAEGFNEVRLEEALLGGADSIAPLGVSLEPLEQRPLPERRRWWQLPAGVKVPHRATESFSSLTKLVYHPHQWVLRYAAKLHAGRAANLPDDALLYGKLAHRLFETYFSGLPNGELAARPARAELDRWLRRTLAEIVEREGAVLDEPGMGVTRERVLATIERAFHALLGHLDEARIVRVSAEVWHDVPFRSDGGDTRLSGSVDLLLEDARSREIVLDVKWGGLDWRGREIEENRALQLATYAYMRSRPDTAGRWPEQAYFIVQTGDIVAADARIFPSARVFAPGMPETAEQIWRRLLRTYDWRLAQIDAGAIEVNVAGTEPDEPAPLPEELAAAPDEALAVNVAPGRYDDYALLTGWEPGV
ncbi:MAG TPA: PD-(D/E)XK nuclease family protein [Gammaproteobacteria bacterium]